MLISFEQINEILSARNIKITGTLHIGAHDCEELGFYDKLGLQKSDIIWIDAVERKVKEAQEKEIPNVYHALITDKDDEEIAFHVSNNVQSSSIYEFGTHAQEHPTVVYVDEIKMKSTTIDTFFERNGLDASKCNFWNFDIQGAELVALKGSLKSMKYAQAIYLEVNTKELYIGCPLIEEIDTFLAEYGYKRVLTNITYHSWGDALYVLEPSTEPSSSA